MQLIWERRVLEIYAKSRKLCVVTKDLAIRSPFSKVGGLFFFGRTVDKIKLHAKGECRADYNRIWERLRRARDEALGRRLLPIWSSA